MSSEGPVPVVRIIVVRWDGSVLLLRRANTSHGEGSWCLPGGKVDYGDTVEEAARRELREETSLQCTSLRFLFYQDSPAREPGGMHCINLYFECEVSGEVELNEESAEHAWVDASEVEKLDVAFRNAEGLARYWNHERSES